MTQVYKMMLGTSGKQWEQLTVKDDGTMTMTFHGTDREICHEVTENADGLLCYPGAMFPGLKSGKWQLMDDVRGLTADEPFLRPDSSKRPKAERTVNHSPLTMNRRQRKPRKPRVERQPSAFSHQPSDIDRHQTSSIDHQTSTTLKAIGMVAAASVALFVIYETGLLIPLGLIGLATGGILK